MINGKPQPFSRNRNGIINWKFRPDTYLDNDKLKELGIAIREEQGDKAQLKSNVYLVNITNEEKAHLKLPAGYCSLISSWSQIASYFLTMIQHRNGRRIILAHCRIPKKERRLSLPQITSSATSDVSGV